MENVNELNEIWFPVVGYEGLYDVSNVGRVRSLNYRGTGKIKVMKLKKEKSGYVRVELRNKTRKIFMVHRLVAQAFIPNPNNYPVINHKNEIKDDNRTLNLEWCTHSYNWKYSGIDKKAQNAAKQKQTWKIAQEIYRQKEGWKTTEKIVNKYSINGELLIQYKSVSDASRQTGIDRSCISACCRGKLKTAGGFIWKFK